MKTLSPIMIGALAFGAVGSACADVSWMKVKTHDGHRRWQTADASSFVDATGRYGVAGDTVFLEAFTLGDTEEYSGWASESESSAGMSLAVSVRFYAISGSSGAINLDGFDLMMSLDGTISGDGTALHFGGIGWTAANDLTIGGVPLFESMSCAPGVLELSVSPSLFEATPGLVLDAAFVDLEGLPQPQLHIAKELGGGSVQGYPDLGMYWTVYPENGDINGDGATNGADLTIVLGAWGTSDPVVDLNHDGIVDGADLAYVLGYWTG